MPRFILYGFTDKNFTRTLSDEQHQKIFDLLHHYNEDWDDIPKDLDSIYPILSKVLWSGVSFSPNEKYWASHGYNTKNFRQLWLIVRERYRELLKDGLNDMQIIRFLENEGWIKVDYNSGDGTVPDGNEILVHKAINFTLNVSLLFPNKEMYLIDTYGWALYCPILVRGGLAKPFLNETQEQLEYALRGRTEEGIVNYSENRIRYLERILELKPDWGDVKKYIRPIDNYEAVNSYRPLPFIKIDKNKGNEEEAINAILKADEEAQKDAKRKGVNTGFYNDIDWYPEI